MTIPVSGFETPLTGPVRTRLGFMAYEGDRGMTGDTARLDGTTLTDAVNPAKNFFNSTISDDGSDRTEKSPNYPNQLGFDANLMEVSGIWPTGRRARRSRCGRAGTYLPRVDHVRHRPVRADDPPTKTVTNLTHPDAPARSGDTIQLPQSAAGRRAGRARGRSAPGRLLRPGDGGRDGRRRRTARPR